jgi:hypothetical protein
MRSCSISKSRVPSAAWPRSSADRATDFESVRGGSTPPGAIVRRRRDVRRGAQAVAPRRTSPFIATRPSERTGDVARRILARGQGARQVWQIVAKLTSSAAELAQSTGAVRPQRGQTHSVTGSPRDPLRPGCACCPAQRVRSRIGPWPRGQSLGSTVSSGGSAKAAPSYGTPPPMCFGQDLLP